MFNEWWSQYERFSLTFNKAPQVVNRDAFYTYGTKKLWDFKIAAYLHFVQEWSKIKIYVDIYIIWDILKTNTQNGKEVGKHITHMMYGRKEGSF